jgi:hypothetical protein
MKRDMDLVRQILFTLEESPDGFQKPETIEVEGWTTAEIRHHFTLLEDAGFVYSPPMPKTGPHGLGTYTSQRIGSYRLTWQGYEFLATVRDPEIWRKTKAGAAKVGGLGVEVFWGLAKECSGD